MANELATVPQLAVRLREATQTALSDVTRWLEAQRNAWPRKTSAERAASSLPTTVEHIEAAIMPLFAPAGSKATAVLLDRLFAVVPMPPPDAMATWIKHLSEYPPDVLDRAIDVVIRRHRWNTPPLIGEVVEAAERDELHHERWGIRHALVGVQFEIKKFLPANGPRISPALPAALSAPTPPRKRAP